MGRFTLSTSIILSILLFSFPLAFPQAKTFEQQCDAAAANPDNPDTKGIGVRWNDIDETTGIEVCRQAVEKDPTSLKLQYQLGRALP